MNIAAKRLQLHRFIDEMDARKIDALYTLFLEEEDGDLQRKKMIMAEREMYLKGDQKTFSPEEVRSMAIDNRSGQLPGE
jgi:hypothetical protein